MNPNLLEMKYSNKLFTPHRACLIIEDMSFGLHVFVEIAITFMNDTGNPT